MISPRNGVFIDYLFGWEDGNVFLTLLQGVDCVDDFAPLKKLERTKLDIQQNISVGSFVKTPNPWNVDVVNGRSRAQSYANGMIFYKQYSRNAVPSDEQLTKDLQELLEIYAKAKAFLDSSKKKYLKELD